MSNEYTRSVLDKVYERELKAMHDLAFPPITYDRPKFKQEYKGESMKCDRTTEVDKYKEIDAMRRLKVRSENITSLADVIIDAARQSFIKGINSSL